LKTRITKSYLRGGFALILVMITILALTTLVASFAISMNTEVSLARNADYDEELEWAGRSGIEWARWELANKCPEQRGYDALNQEWAGGTSPCSNDVLHVPIKGVFLGRARIANTTITDMERKWDINNVALPQHPQPEIMQKALSLIGVTDTGLASAIQDSIFDWCNPNSLAGFSGAKDDYYMHLNPPYYCKGGPIDDLSELLLIKGISPEIYWGSNSTNHPISAYQQHGGGPFNQPASGRPGSFSNKDNPVYPFGLYDLFSPMGGKLNVNTASLQALELIPGIDENAAAHILQQRAGPDGIDGTDDDLPFQNIGQINGSSVSGTPQNGRAAQGLAAYIDVRSYIFQVRVDAEINQHTNTYYGIISRSGNGAQQLKCVKFYWQ
jgi:general secretion pathway protein K